MEIQSDGFDEIMISKYWRLCEELTILQATMLIIGLDPASRESQCEHWKVQERPDGYEAVKHGLSSALRKGNILGTNALEFGFDENSFPMDEIPNTTDIYNSTIERDSLVKWLRSRGVNTGFFFPIEESLSSEPDYLNPKHPRYSAKLAATVGAWQAVTDTGGRSARQALERWLREHAARFGMTNETGNPVAQAVEDCSKVANWEQSGGAPKTPKKTNPPTPKA